MKILDFDIYLDGGTIEIKTDEGDLYIDNRLFTKTEGKFFNEYPKDNIESIELDYDAKHNLCNALKTYVSSNNDIYLDSIQELIIKLKK